jgi:NitT/TauT family transport system ATP-binding protein
MPKLLLEVSHVGHVYQTPECEKEALKDVSFQIREGEFVSLVGPSGCGKSTLLTIIAGLERPTFGEVRIDGRRISGPTTEIGYMPQKDHLFSWRNIYSNITLGLEIQKKGPEYYRKAEEMMEKYGLRDARHMRPDQLSGGMRQRCSLIRTLVTDPRFLLLDEAFSALDYQTRVAVSIDIHTIIRNEHKTVLLVTHDISESLMLSDRVIVLSKRPGTVKTIHDLSALKDIAPMERLEHEAFGSMIKDRWGELDIHG